ncbi:type II secretion system protein [Rhodopirellula sp. JC740]|uniref:Type II secretion system protein n=1 Tax=Rhodopirellula halodulae TaxID=2894198 RepID=A0ABS8NLJ0_9BACT|nr:type II secretion system protein [Rhodopirellula sp. JC740]
MSFVIISIISGMVAIALSGAQRQANDTRAKALVDRLNLSMLRLYEEESLRRMALPVDVKDGEAVSQAQLIFKRDWLRAILPNNRADMDVGSGRSGSTNVLGIPYRQQDNPGTRWTVANEASRALASQRYRQRVMRTLNVGTWDLAWTEWTPEHESAECLYQIFASSTLDGEPLLKQLRTRDIADTDGDGMPEIVDPWGVPLLWMRWPTGFYLKNRWVVDESDTTSWPTVGELASIIANRGDDPLDLLRMDPRYRSEYDYNLASTATNLVDPRINDNTVMVDKLTFAVRPMIVSAGSDGEFDLVTSGPGTGRETVGDDLIANLRASDDRAGNVRTLNGPVFFPDPFFTLNLVGASADGPRPLLERLGAVSDVNGDRTDNSADNIYPVLGF